MRARLAAELAEQAQRPCFDQDPAYHEDPRGKSIAIAVQACIAAGAEPGCAVSQDPTRCPRRREEQNERSRRESYDQRLRLAGVPDREIEILGGIGTPALWRTEPMIEALRIAHLPRRPALVVFNGDVGRGKTVAACYLIGRFGGAYTKAARILRKDFDLAQAEAVAVLVVDQLGREDLGKEEWGNLAKIEDLIDTRYAARLTTVLCANLSRADFDLRYQRVIADRLKGHGEWHQFEGPSYRGVAA